MSLSARSHSIGISARSGAVVALVSANVIWGTTFVVTKPMLERVPPITVATGRFVIALLVLLPLLAMSQRQPILNRTTAAMGFTGVVMVYGCQNVGLTYTGAGNAALIHGGLPVFTILIAAPALGESICGRRLLGLVLSLVGVLMVVLRGSGNGFGVSLVGDGLVLLSVLSLSVFLVLGRMVFSGENRLELIGGVIVFGVLFLIPASGIELAVGGMAQPTAGDMMGLVYLGAVASTLTFVLSAYGLRHLNAGQAATFAHLKLLVGIAVAAIVLNESISPLQLTGGIFIIGGLWLTARPSADGLSDQHSPLPAYEGQRNRDTTSTVMPRIPWSFWCPTSQWDQDPHHGRRSRSSPTSSAVR